MKASKKLGIWMDHSTATFIDYDALKKHSTIASEFTETTRVDALQKGENLMHNKEQQLNEAYFKQIGEKLLDYDNVLLFGPTNAKTELHNFLSKDTHYNAIKFELEAADKMSENEQSAYVRKHFENV